MGNVALNMTTASSSCIDPYAASRAVDGNLTDPTSRWLCGTLPGWMSVDLGAPYWIGQWTVRSIGGYAGWPVTYCMTSFKLQFSVDNQSWYDIDIVNGNTSCVCTRNLPIAQKARFWRVYVQSNGGITANKVVASIMELELNEAAPTSSYLSGLTISSGTLAPAFVKTTGLYADSVTYQTSSVTVTPTAEDTAATIKVNGTAVQSGSASLAIPLAVGGVTPITVVVTPKVGDPRSYVINVTRLDSTRLTSLVAKDQASNALALDPVFDPAKIGYAVNIPFDSTATSVNLTPTREGTTATITVNGVAVASGAASGAVNVPAVGAKTDVPVVVTAAGATPTTYTVSVVKASSPYLKNVVLSAGRISFSKTNYTYTVNAGSNSSITVTATSEDAAATVAITLGGTSYANGASIPLAVGLNQITIKVTSAVGGDTKTYLFNTTRS